MLLENGFADGAMARWRTLHEVTMTAALIAGGDEDLARRYMAHDAVDIKRQADDHDKTQVPLGYLPVPPAERRAIDRKFEHAIELFGSDFGGAYGWAAKHLGRPRPTFRDIQHEVDRSKMNPSYKVASFNVHAGSRSMFYRLSDIDNSGVILAGRSNAGMSQPAENAASSLLHISSLLYDTVWSIEQTMEIRAAIELRNLLSRSPQQGRQKA